MEYKGTDSGQYCGLGHTAWWVNHKALSVHSDREPSPRSHHYLQPSICATAANFPSYKLHTTTVHVHRRTPLTNHSWQNFLYTNFNHLSVLYSAVSSLSPRETFRFPSWNSHICMWISLNKLLQVHVVIFKLTVHHTYCLNPSVSLPLKLK